MLIVDELVCVVVAPLGDVVLIVDKMVCSVVVLLKLED